MSKLKIRVLRIRFDGKGTKHFDGDGAGVSNAPKGYLRIVHLRVVYSSDVSGETIDKTTGTRIVVIMDTF